MTPVSTSGNVRGEVLHVIRRLHHAVADGLAAVAMMEALFAADAGGPIPGCLHLAATTETEHTGTLY